MAEFFTHCGKDLDVTKIGCLTLMTVFRACHEPLYVFVEKCRNLGVLFDEECKEADEIEETANRHYRNVAVFLHHVHNMSLDQLWHELNNVLSSVSLTATAGGEEVHGLLGVLLESLKSIDVSCRGDHVLKLMIVIVLVDFKALILSEVKGKPVSELLTVQSFPDLHLSERPHVHQVHRGVHVANETGPRVLSDRYADSEGAFLERHLCLEAKKFLTK